MYTLRIANGHAHVPQLYNAVYAIVIQLLQFKIAHASSSVCDAFLHTWPTFTLFRFKKNKKKTT